MRLALIGDIHLFQTEVHPSRLVGKRLLGHTNLMLNRRFRFNHRVLGPLIERAGSLGVDMALLSGDVTTTSLEDEFHDVATYLRPLAAKVPTIVVPGNHDKYTFRSVRKKRMDTHMGDLLPESFPHVRHLSGPWRLLCLDSAQPQLFWSRGALGYEQMQAVIEFMDSLTEHDAVVVLCHYPAKLPAGIPHSWGHALAEAGPLHRLLTETPARIVYVHGHVHKPWFWDPANGGKVGNGDSSGLLYINTGSPCLTSHRYPFGQGFWELHLPEDARGKLGLIHHIPMSADGTRPNARQRRLASQQTGNLTLTWQTNRVL